MALTVGDREVRPLTADDVLRMVEVGILAETEPVELLHGVLTRMSPQSPEHARLVLRLNRWLAPGFADARYDVHVQAPLSVPDPTSLPEPDLVVAEHTDDLTTHRRDAWLVIEVAVSSQRTDTRVKPALYAAGGTPEYWVIDVPRKQVHVHADPTADGFASERTAGAAETLQPVAVDIAPLDLADLFAGL